MCDIIRRAKIIYWGEIMERPLFISCEVWRDAYSISRIIKEICKKIDENNYQISQYSQGIDSIGIIVNCHPDENLVAGWGKPRTYISYKNRYADVRLPVPYVDYINADYDTQYLMVVKNIIVSIDRIGEKCRKSKRATFDSDSFIRDFLQKLDISPDSLKDIIGVIPDERYKQ